MKKFVIALVLVLGWTASAEAQEVVVKAGDTIIVQTRLFDAPKPQFRTPLRNGMWYSGVIMYRGLQLNRQWRYNRLERLLGKE